MKKKKQFFKKKYKIKWNANQTAKIEVKKYP
jgi:hypothetical protein